MATLKYKDIIKMSKKEKEEKLKEMKLELTKVNTGKSTKRKEIKKIIARILTSNTQEPKSGLENK